MLAREDLYPGVFLAIFGNGIGEVVIKKLCKLDLYVNILLLMMAHIIRSIKHQNHKPLNLIIDCISTSL